MSVRRWAVVTAVSLVTLGLTGCEPIETTTTGTGGKPAAKPTGKATAQTGASVKITASKKTCWAGRVGATARQGCGSATFQVKSSNGSYNVSLRKTKGNDGISVVLVVNGKKVDRGRISSSSSVVAISYVSS